MSQGNGSNPLSAAMQQQRPQPQAQGQGPMQPAQGPALAPGANQPFQWPNNIMWMQPGMQGGQGQPPNQVMTPPGMGQPAPQTGWNGRPLNMPDLGTFGGGQGQGMGGPKPWPGQGPGQHINSGPAVDGGRQNQAMIQQKLASLFGGSSKGMPNISQGTMV